jgi:serine/threonine protein kinase
MTRTAAVDPDATASAELAPPERLADAPAGLGDVLQGRWSVTEILSGGQAWVLIVDDVEQGNRRAIKVPFSGSLTGDAELVALFGLEPQPHVVTALDTVELDGRRGLVLEYVPGSLAELIRPKHFAPPPSPPPAAALVPRGEILQEICDGMAYLSSKGEFAHLDLKPSNVLIDDAGMAKIADFGMARQVRIRQGAYPAASGGTWAYAAPEVLGLKPCDSRADIFSFGVMLYQVCTGMLPYPFKLASSAADQRAQLLEYYQSPGPERRCDELYYPEQLKATQIPLPPPSIEVGEVISDCLQQYPGKRPSSFRKLAEQLAGALGIPVVQAEAVPLAEIDRQRRVLAMSQALIRLGRFDEAVRSLNRLLSKPVSEAFLSEAKQAAQLALFGAGRPDVGRWL